jgi:hypothetical protein
MIGKFTYENYSDYFILASIQTYDQERVLDLLHLDQLLQRLGSVLAIDVCRHLLNKVIFVFV